MADSTIEYIQRSSQTTIPLKMIDLGDGTFAASVSGPLTDAELRASAIPVTLDAEGIIVGSVSVPTNAPIVGQKVIAVTGTAVSLSATSVELPTSLVIVYALSTNTEAMVVGPATATNVKDGSGNSYILEPGQSVAIMAGDLASVYINGIAGDVATFTAG